MCNGSLNVDYKLLFCLIPDIDHDNLQTHFSFCPLNNIKFNIQ